MSSRNVPSAGTRGSDPRALRALAHPVRLELLNLLQREGPLTASRCAELLDLTPKVCSYHLNLLGSHGLIEETGEGKGRSRPWRLVMTGLSYVHSADEKGSTARTADEFARTMLARDASLVEAFIARRRGLPKTWRNRSTMSSNPLRLTASQLEAFGAELIEVLERYRRLSEKPDAGARPVHVAMYAVPDLREPGGE
jgi:DNA-binding transcriptional ArsR family regulator